MLMIAVCIAIGAPLVGAVLVLLGNRRIRNGAGQLGTGLIAVSFVASVLVLWGVMQRPGAVHLWEFDWLKLGGANYLRVGLMVDAASAMMLVVVSVVSLLVHVFSVSYMKGDGSKARYFGLLQLFCFSMLGLVASGNLIQLYFFWELVGVCSYLLIGFWHTRPAASAAATKAFVVNRVGDAGLLAGILLLMAYGVTPRFTDWQPYGPYFLGEGWLPTTASLLIFLGCVGKSAQFPLFIWLPDAMEGPTPISSLIHAATMVAAGVFLLLRIHPLLSPDALAVIACVGAVTAFIGAFAALTQWDMKRILAYSTISQLGYMVMAMGLASPAAGFFHLITHAFFKCGLFLVAATVIHLVHRAWHAQAGVPDLQDLRNLGGLYKPMPWLMVAYGILAAALIGLPLTSGGLSKEMILTVAYAGIGTHGWRTGVAVLAFGTTALTAYYVARQGMLIFWGEPRFSSYGEPRVSAAMRMPIMVLAVCALWFLFDANPVGEGWVARWVTTGETLPHESHWPPMLMGWACIALGLACAILHLQYNHLGIYVRHVSIWNRISFYAGYVDRFYMAAVVPLVKTIGAVFSAVDRYLLDGVIHLLVRIVAGRADGQSLSLAAVSSGIDRTLIDGSVRLTANTLLLGGRMFQGLQTGRLQTYLLFSLGVALAIVLYMIC